MDISSIVLATSVDWLTMPSEESDSLWEISINSEEAEAKVEVAT
jgi:hypothetical protein